MACRMGQSYDPFRQGKITYWLPADAKQINMDSVNKVIIFEKAGLIFIFNFSTGNSIFGYKFWAT